MWRECKSLLGMLQALTCGTLGIFLGSPVKSTTGCPSPKFFNPRPMNEIVEKYEAKLERLNEAVELKKRFLTEGELEVLAQLKVLLTEVVTDLRAIRTFSK